MWFLNTFLTGLRKMIFLGVWNENGPDAIERERLKHPMSLVLERRCHFHFCNRGRVEFAGLFRVKGRGRGGAVWGPGAGLPRPFSSQALALSPEPGAASSEERVRARPRRGRRPRGGPDRELLHLLPSRPHRIPSQALRGTWLSKSKAILTLLTPAWPM